MSDQVYLKCTSSLTENFTRGGIYRVLDKVGELYKIVGDAGTICGITLNTPLWDFEVVSDTKEPQKLTPRSLGCFQEVADVIGENGAEVELQKVIDSKSTDWESDGSESLISCFDWQSSPHGYDFWDSIDDGEIPEDYTPAAKEQTKEQPKSTPEFGDVLHIHNTPYVFIKEPENDVEWCVVNSKGTMMWFHKKSFDEYHQYAPDKTQELREQILKDWQQQGLEWAHDTEVCRVDMSVGDIIDFILGNGYRKTGE